jgi:hypothetical protein
MINITSLNEVHYVPIDLAEGHPSALAEGHQALHSGGRFALNRRLTTITENIEKITSPEFASFAQRASL